MYFINDPIPKFIKQYLEYIFTNNLLINAKQPDAFSANFIYSDNTSITLVTDNIWQGRKDSGNLEK